MRADRAVHSPEYAGHYGHHTDYQTTVVASIACNGAAPELVPELRNFSDPEEPWSWRVRAKRPHRPRRERVGASSPLCSPRLTREAHTNIMHAVPEGARCRGRDLVAASVVKVLDHGRDKGNDDKTKYHQLVR